MNDLAVAKVTNRDQLPRSGRRETEKWNLGEVVETTTLKPCEVIFCFKVKKRSDFCFKVKLSLVYFFERLTVFSRSYTGVFSLRVKGTHKSTPEEAPKTFFWNPWLMVSSGF